jgi:hypothetical protein
MSLHEIILTSSILTLLTSRLRCCSSLPCVSAPHRHEPSALHQPHILCYSVLSLMLIIHLLLLLLLLTSYRYLSTPQVGHRHEPPALHQPHAGRC